MTSSIKLICGPTNDEQLLSISIPENDNPLNTILVGFTGGIDSSFMLYLLVKLNSEQHIPYIIQPITINSFNGSVDSPIVEQWHYIPKIIQFLRIKTHQLINHSKFLLGNSNLSGNVQLVQGLVSLLKNKDNKLLFLGDTVHPPNLTVSYVRTWSTHEQIVQPFSNLNKSHIIDAMIKLDLEDLINIAPRCPIYHKYSNSPCDNFFCTERRWAYSALNRTDLLQRFLLTG